MQHGHLVKKSSSHMTPYIKHHVTVTSVTHDGPTIATLRDASNVAGQG